MGLEADMRIDVSRRNIGFMENDCGADRAALYIREMTFLILTIKHRRDLYESSQLISLR